MGRSCLHSRPSARQGMPMAAPRIAQHNPIQPVPWHCPYKSRSGMLALISMLNGEQGGGTCSAMWAVPPPLTTGGCRGCLWLP